LPFRGARYSQEEIPPKAAVNKFFWFSKKKIAIPSFKNARGQAKSG